MWISLPPPYYYCCHQFFFYKSCRFLLNYFFLIFFIIFFIKNYDCFNYNIHFLTTIWMEDRRKKIVFFFFFNSSVCVTTHFIHTFGWVFKTKLGCKKSYTGRQQASEPVGQSFAQVSWFFFANFLWRFWKIVYEMTSSVFHHCKTVMVDKNGK